jgi:hypothetical protein
MIARLEDVFYIEISNLENRVYLIQDQDGLILINSTSGSHPELLINLILELIYKLKNSIKYLILTDCNINNVGGSYLIYEIFKPKVISHYPDSVKIRHGECFNKKFNPVPVSLEIREKIYILNDLIIINSKVPTEGSVIIKYKNILFTPTEKLSALRKKVKYVCNMKDCIKVE